MLGKDNPKIAAEIEEAIKFLIRTIDESGHNPKPVIFHSVKVGMYLYREGYSKEVVIAGLLHDLLEDSAATSDEIKKQFGEKVNKLVEANSFDASIKDKKKRYLETCERCRKVGKDALVIKAADILDNSYYYRFADDKKLYKWLYDVKLKHFVEKTKAIIGSERVWKDLRERRVVLSRNK